MTRSAIRLAMPCCSEVAIRLKACLRETDVLGRLGGDEFAIIQSGESEPARGGAQAFAERIIEIIAKPFGIDGNEVNIGTSIGIAFAPEHAGNPDELLKMADMALYRAKSVGRNSYLLLRPGDDRGRRRPPRGRDRIAARHPESTS